MPISVINKTESSNINIPASTLVGGAAGLALRQFFPVFQDEVDYVLFRQTEIAKKADLIYAKDSFINSAKSALAKDKNNEALKLFIKRVEAKSISEAKAAKDKFKKAPAIVQKEFKKLMKEFLTNMKTKKQVYEETMKTYVKQKRPYGPYVLPGLAFGAAIAYVYNVVGKISET